MTFPTDDILLGPRSWGKRPATEGVIFHTTEYADWSRASAVQCAKDQSKRTNTGGWAQPGSYNFIVYDGGVLLTVPYLEASGGLNPASPYWNPDAWLQKLLSAKAWADPTMYHVQISFSGKTAQIAAGHMPENMWQTAAKLVHWIEASAWGNDNQIVSGHMHWQDNRSDPSQMAIDRIIKDTNAIPDQTAPPPPDYKALYAAELVKVGDLTTKLKDTRLQLSTAQTTVSEGLDLAKGVVARLSK